MKKYSCLFMAIIICTLSVLFPISSNAETLNNVVVEDSNKREQILFSKLFFNKKDDINRIIEYFDTEITSSSIPKLEEIDIFKIIKDLNLNTNYEETKCIIKNIIYIDEYVEEEKIKDATKGSNPSELFGGIISKIPQENSRIQLYWDKDTLHRDVTTLIAEDYFSSSVASKIGKANRQVDIDYSSGMGAIGNKQNQYIHFNEYASGSEDSRDYAAATWFVASSLAWDKGKKDDAYMYLGYALHPLQDKESHGQIDRGSKVPHHLYDVNGDNRSKADKEVGWEWTNSNKNALKKVSGSRKRYNAAVNVTREYLSQYRNEFV